MFSLLPLLLPKQHVSTINFHLQGCVCHFPTQLLAAIKVLPLHKDNFICAKLASLRYTCFCIGGLSKIYLFVQSWSLLDILVCAKLASLLYFLHTPSLSSIDYKTNLAYIEIEKIAHRPLLLGFGIYGMKH